MVCVVHIITITQSHTYVVTNPVRGLLDRKISEGRPQSFNEGIKQRRDMTTTRIKEIILQLVT